MFSVVPTIKLAARKISYLIASFLSFLISFTFLISLVWLRSVPYFYNSLPCLQKEWSKIINSRDLSLFLIHENLWKWVGLHFDPHQCNVGEDNFLRMKRNLKFWKSACIGHVQWTMNILSQDQQTSTRDPWMVLETRRSRLERTNHTSLQHRLLHLAKFMASACRCGLSTVASLTTSFYNPGVWHACERWTNDPMSCGRCIRKTRT